MTTVQLYFALRRSKLPLVPCVAWYLAMSGEAKVRKIFKDF